MVRVDAIVSAIETPPGSTPRRRQALQHHAEHMVMKAMAIRNSQCADLSGPIRG